MGMDRRGVLGVVSFAVLFTCTAASFNLFLSPLEVKELMGVSAELSYVQNGVINDYALNFWVPVPAEKNEVSFVWQRLGGSSLPYAVSVEVVDSPDGAGSGGSSSGSSSGSGSGSGSALGRWLHPPKLNISDTGTIPMQMQTWVVQLECVKGAMGSVETVIWVNVTLAGKPVNLHIRRRKLCAPTPTPDHDDDLDGVLDDGLNNLQDAGPVQKPVLNSSSTVFYVAIGCAILVLAMLVALSVAFYVRNRKLRRHGDMLQESRLVSSTGSGGGGVVVAGIAVGVGEPAALLPPMGPPCVPPLPLPPPPPGSYVRRQSAPSAHSGRSGRSSRSGSGAGAYSPLEGGCMAGVPPRSLDDSLQQRIQQLKVQRCRVRLRSVVMEGTFGRVYWGTYADEARDDSAEREVLVKTVKDHASQSQISLLLQEGLAMYGLSHKNILPILGVSLEDHTSPFLLYPLNGHSNLKRFLQKCKLSPEGVAHTLTTQEVVDMALQVAQGLQYLHRKRILHKDVATRNCVVDDGLRVQIADNALARDLFPADYHCLGDNENRPIKWLAVESLTHKSFTTASDVWMFGVLMWELTTLAQQPYAEVDAFEMGGYLSDGYRLAQPVNCPDELYAVMAYCWSMSGEDRPTINQLQLCLEEFKAQLTKYV